MLPERLKLCRQTEGLSQKQVADDAGISLRAYQYYETGEKDPTSKVLLALADYFDVSLDYLCGRTDDVEKRGGIVYPQFAERLKELRIKHGLDIWQFADLFEISPRNYAGYEIGETMPDLPVIASFADYFDVSLDYLVGRSDAPTRR